MFGDKKSTDECYLNKQTFKCCNICLCPNTYVAMTICVMHVSYFLSTATLMQSYYRHHHTYICSQLLQPLLALVIIAKVYLCCCHFGNTANLMQPHYHYCSRQPLAITQLQHHLYYLRVSMWSPCWQVFAAPHAVLHLYVLASQLYVHVYQFPQNNNVKRLQYHYCICQLPTVSQLQALIPMPKGTNITAMASIGAPCK